MSHDDQIFKRLGKRELGRHAFEEQMPAHIARLIAEGDDRNTHVGIIPKLANALARDPDVKLAYLCTGHLVQIHKLPGEGAHFCGYRNMQMLCLALGFSGYECNDTSDLCKKLSIPELQNLIEQAWDQGFNSHGRILTGGIKGTRKHVGTSEAEALLLSLKIPCTGKAFKGGSAVSKLLDSVEKHFTDSSLEIVADEKVNQTFRLPIFLQRPQHSVMIVGILRLKSGKRRLLIFDPAWRPLQIDSNGKGSDESLSWMEVLAMRQYSKSERYLKRFAQFETLMVDE